MYLYPKMVKNRQIFEDAMLEDYFQTFLGEMDKVILDKIDHGIRIAITVGSRSIDQCAHTT